VKIKICAVGRIKASAERDLIDRYTKRILWPFEIIEVEERRKLSGAERKKQEHELMGSVIPVGSLRIVLDERGVMMSSLAFAEQIRRWRDDNRDITFLIGGAGGIDSELRDSADIVLSFGQATWPHMLARGMLVEQIYRSQEILAGHPYHRN
jgi:23S rRNA (pseudouridine1915-N3)-methyltransferase